MNSESSSAIQLPFTIIHNSRQKLYRKPFGAVPAGQNISFRLRIEGEINHIQEVYLSYAYGLYAFRSSYVRLVKQPGTSTDLYLCEISLMMPLEPALFFYWFKIETSGGPFYFTRNPENIEGGGVVTRNQPRFHPGVHHPSAWQVTVYDAGFKVPDWLTGHVIYQIFPDRFSRDSSFTLKRFAAEDRPERIFHEDWGEDVDIKGKPETGYMACDFYGGSLAGIQEKLDYLSNLGITIIYLNPVFEARSNHRYDTGDYMKIDPLLGDEQAFKTLCDAARKRGIRIILDGVFSHTGADSRYFNKYGRYDEIGAWQEAHGQGQSPYSSWYTFYHKDNKLCYRSWWDFPDLPSVNEHDRTFCSAILGKNGAARYWLRQGASGWRLDVSDELPDPFIRELRRAVHQEKEDAVVLGEVWEDAANKVSFGRYRDFLLGRTHDNVMGYPFQQALIGWLSGAFQAGELYRRLEIIREHYPEPAFMASFNLISSHDIVRAITALAGEPDPGTREAEARLFLTDEQRKRGEALLRLAVLFQMIFPGCPVIYYGDETGMEGYRDPFNRRTFPWDRENKALQMWFSSLGRMRRDWPVLRHGTLDILWAEGDCIVLQRRLEDDTGSGPSHILAAINRAGEPRCVQLANRSIHLETFGWLLEKDGQAFDPMCH